MKDSALKIEHIAEKKQEKNTPDKGKLIRLYDNFIQKAALRQGYTKIKYASIAPDLILAITSGVTGYNIGVSFGLGHSWCIGTAFATAACIDGILAIYKESAQEKAHAGDLASRSLQWWSAMSVIFFLYGLTATASLLSNGFIKDAYVDKKKVTIQERTELIEKAIIANQVEGINEDPLLKSWNEQLSALKAEKETMLDQTTNYARKQYLAGSIKSKLNRCTDCYTLRAFSESIERKDAEIDALQKKINDFAYQSKIQQSDAKKGITEMVNGDIEKTNSNAEKAGNRLSVFLNFLEPTLALLSFLLFNLMIEKRREQGKKGIPIKQSITMQAIIDRMKIPFKRMFAQVAIQNQEFDTRIAIKAGRDIDEQNNSPTGNKTENSARTRYTHAHRAKGERGRKAKGERRKAKGANWVEKAKALHAEGESYPDIAKAVGRAQSTVWKQLNK